MTLAGKLEIRETQVRNIKLKIDPSEKTAKFTRKMDTLRLVLICSLIIGLTTCMIEGVAGANDDGLAVDLKMVGRY